MMPSWGRTRTTNSTSSFLSLSRNGKFNGHRTRAQQGTAHRPTLWTLGSFTDTRTNITAGKNKSGPFRTSGGEVISPSRCRSLTAQNPSDDGRSRLSKPAACARIRPHHAVTARTFVRIVVRPREATRAMDLQQEGFFGHRRTGLVVRCDLRVMMYHSIKKWETR